MERHEETNIIICGVGGQGVILISEILGKAATKDGFNITGSEIHGMAARGGSVSTHLTIGKTNLSPIIPIGKCDILVAMEPVEALRNVSHLNPLSLVLLNTQIFLPYTVSLGKSRYPPLEKIIEELEKSCEQVVALDVFQLAKKAGSLLTANTAMIGALLGSGRLSIETETVKKEIENRFGAKASGVNLKAFDLGYVQSQESLKR